MLETSFGLNFFLKTPRNESPDGTRHIYMRITVNRQPRDIATKRIWHPSKWNIRAGRATGNKEDSKELNSYLDSLSAKVFQAKKALLETDKEVTADAIKNLLLGKDEDKRTILTIFKEHNDQISALVGADFAAGTLERYETSLKHTREYIKWKYNEDDFDIKKLDFEFISQFEYGQKYAQEIDDWSALLLAEVEEHFERIKADVDQSVDAIDKAAAAIKSNQRPVHFSDKRQAFYYGLATSLPWSVVAIVSLCLFSWLISTGEEYQERRRIVNAYENAPQYRILMENGEIVQEDGSNYLKLRPQAKKGDVLIGREYVFDKKSKEMRIPLGRK
ncbi:MAG: hypothetical protein ABIN80_13525 [Dyadobacter sp.]|uniref:hypothetical protein n=1 Tax=Dyadobacter sp. TaxID=1914288 RepID=UPI003267BFCF